MADHLLAPDVYRDRLREILKSKARIIPNANDWYAERVAPGGSSHPEKAAFQLPSSDRCQRELVSLWELFDERDEFQECVEQLASRAERIRQKTPFTMIATATATAKHLLEQIHALVESEREPVRVESLPHFPYLATDRRARLDFGGEQVLILADVVTSGSLVRHLAEVVEELGGNVVAALAVVLVGRELIDQLPQSDQAPLLEFGRAKSPKTIRLFNLTDYAIPHLERRTFGRLPEPTRPGSGRLVREAPDGPSPRAQNRSPRAIQPPSCNWSSPRRAGRWIGRSSRRSCRRAHSGSTSSISSSSAVG